MSRIVLMCCSGDSSAAIANTLIREFGDVRILVEQKEPRGLFLKRRARRLGLLAVAGQLAFVASLAPLLKRLSRRRIAEIAASNNLDLRRGNLDQATHVDSVNSSEALEWLKREQPAVVVVNGTRIIAHRILEATGATFINTHCGITPEYRGAHGGYWALYRGDRENCGVTVHLVDPGVDTGDIVAQARIEPGPTDNFATYPYLQLAGGLPLLIEAVRASLRGSLETKRRAGHGAVWYHPTAWQYVITGLRRRIW